MRRHPAETVPSSAGIVTIAAVVCLLAATVLAASCGGGDDDGKASATPVESQAPTPAASPLPADPAAGVGAFEDFVASVQGDDLEEAWSLYAASIEGTTEEHNSAYGCDFGAFSFEFPRMQHLFDRVAPFEVAETFGAAQGSTTIEMRLLGADGASFLGTVVRVQPLEDYRVQYLNSGEVSQVPGAPDPQPSPDDPTGICGIWTGTR